MELAVRRFFDAKLFLRFQIFQHIRQHNRHSLVFLFSSIRPSKIFFPSTEEFFFP